MTIALRLRALLGCLPLLLAGVACAPPEADAAFDMAAYLEETAAGVDPVRNRFANSALLEAMEALPARTNDRDRLLFRLAKAEQTLYAVIGVQRAKITIRRCTSLTPPETVQP